MLLGQDDLSMTDYKISVSFLFNSAKFYHRTRFQLTLPVADHNVTKNLTGHRMHVEGPQIYQNFRQKSTFGRENGFFAKKKNT